MISGSVWLPLSWLSRPFGMDGAEGVEPSTRIKISHPALPAELRAILLPHAFLHLRSFHARRLRHPLLRPMRQRESGPTSRFARLRPGSISAPLSDVSAAHYAFSFALAVFQSRFQSRSALEYASCILSCSGQVGNSGDPDIARCRGSRPPLERGLIVA